MFNNISSSLAGEGVVASSTNFRISPGTSPDPTDLFLLSFANLFLIVLELMIKVSPELANCIIRIL